MGSKNKIQNKNQKKHHKNRLLALTIYVEIKKLHPKIYSFSKIVKAILTTISNYHY